MHRVELTADELRTLVNLVDGRVRDLHPEIRRSRVSTVTDELKHDLEDMQRLLEKLEQAAAERPSKASTRGG
jgi:hypothetical protein